MRLRKLAAIGLSITLAFSLAACGNNADESASGNNSGTTAETTATSYGDIHLGTDYTTLQADIKLISNYTDMTKKDFYGTTWDEYIAKFNELYPNIHVTVDAITDYEEEMNVRLSGGDWGDICMIPSSVPAENLSDFFISYGSLYSVNQCLNYVGENVSEGNVYGLPSAVHAQGIVYNKQVFDAAGIKTLPTTPNEFINDLQLIKDNTVATPLYTNYASGWALSAWDNYIGVNATGDENYMNQVFVHTKNPFKDPGDGTHPYNVYKILYEAVSRHLTENDFVTTDWETSRKNLNNGTIGCMVLGAWAINQIKNAGPNGDNIKYMPFPITIDGKQYSAAKSDYCYGISKDSSEDNQIASLIFVKWMIEQSGYAEENSSLPVAKGDTKYPAVYADFTAAHVTFLADADPYSGDENLLSKLNSDSTLAVTAGGESKMKELVESASTGSTSFDDIMNKWNSRWEAAISTNNVEAK